MPLLKENRITVSFQEDTKKKLEQAAQRKGWNLSQLVREIVKEYLESEEQQDG